MKKTFLGFLAAVTVLSSGATTVFAAGPGGVHHFVDADGDGICDNANCVCIYTDADGDGICDTCGLSHRSCPNGDGKYFVDADGDGVCDHYASGQGQGRYGHGSQGRHGNGFRGGRGR